jgi:hypothetical protein
MPFLGFGSCLFGIWLMPFLGFGSCLFGIWLMPFLGFGSCLFGICLMPFLGFGIHEITEIEIVQEPVRKLKAETIDKALQQIRSQTQILSSF